ncbi:unnamed protein product [Pedinophyceae sp. YPF-701]|nr:unnamed protein product [Pedinophyceae sp. YPF-701]
MDRYAVVLSPQSAAGPASTEAPASSPEPSPLPPPHRRRASRTQPRADRPSSSVRQGGSGRAYNSGVRLLGGTGARDRAASGTRVPVREAARAPAPSGDKERRASAPRQTRITVDAQRGMGLERDPPRGAEPAPAGLRREQPGSAARRERESRFFSPQMYEAARQAFIARGGAARDHAAGQIPRVAIHNPNKVYGRDEAQQQFQAAPPQPPFDPRQHQQYSPPPWAGWPPPPPWAAWMAPPPWPPWWAGAPPPTGAAQAAPTPQTQEQPAAPATAARPEPTPAPSPAATPASVRPPETPPADAERDARAQSTPVTTAQEDEPTLGEPNDTPVPDDTPLREQPSGIGALIDKSTEAPQSPRRDPPVLVTIPEASVHSRQASVTATPLRVSLREPAPEPEPQAATPTPPVVPAAIDVRAWGGPGGAALVGPIWMPAQGPLYAQPPAPLTPQAPQTPHVPMTPPATTPHAAPPNDALLEELRALRSAIEGIRGSTAPPTPAARTEGPTEVSAPQTPGGPSTADEPAAAPAEEPAEAPEKPFDLVPEAFDAIHAKRDKATEEAFMKLKQMQEDLTNIKLPRLNFGRDPEPPLSTSWEPLDPRDLGGDPTPPHIVAQALSMAPGCVTRVRTSTISSPASTRAPSVATPTRPPPAPHRPAPPPAGPSHTEPRRARTIQAVPMPQSAIPTRRFARPIVRVTPPGSPSRHM